MGNAWLVGNEIDLFVSLTCGRMRAQQETHQGKNSSARRDETATE
jgi:hypothetical protein